MRQIKGQRKESWGRKKQIDKEISGVQGGALQIGMVEPFIIIAFHFIAPLPKLIICRFGLMMRN